MTSEIKINNKYIGVTEGALLYLTKDNINIMLKRNDCSENLYSFFSVNESGKKIFETVSGTSTVSEFITEFCDKYNISFEKNKAWILRFIIEMIQKKALILSETPIENGRIASKGDREFISPMHATIEITEKCNLRCKHCYLEADIKKTAIIDYDRFVKLVDTLVENNVINVELTGGEIFMHPRIADILRLCFEKFAMVGILTNGTIMTGEVLSILKEYKDRTIVNVSIDNVHPEEHDEFRGMKGAWEASCNTVRILSKNGINVRVASSITKDNMWQVEDLAKLSVSLGATVFSFNFIEEFGRGATYKQNDDYVDVIKYNEYINKVIRDYKDIIPVIKEEDRALTIEHENCGSGNRSIVIGADGNIRPCALSPKVNFIGNVFEENFPDIFKKPAVKKLPDILPPHVKNGCDPKCRYILNCRGCYIKGFERNKINNTCCSWITSNHLEDVYELFKG